jgi:hypothetical protein
MSAWKYSISGVAPTEKGLRIGLRVETEHWVKFGTLVFPYNYLTGEVMSRLVHEWSKLMDAPPEIDTPFSLTWSTDE